MLQPQPHSGQIVDTALEAVLRLGHCFSISAPVGQMATHVPQKVHSEPSSGASFSVDGFEANPRFM